MIACDPGVQTALPGGEVISWWSDPQRMRDELKAKAPKDVERFFEAEQELQRLAAYLQPFFLEAPPDMVQLFFMRPIPGWSQYRTPVDRLYL